MTLLRIPRFMKDIKILAQLCVGDSRITLNKFENMSWIQQTRVNFFRGQVVLTNQEYFRRLRSRRFGFENIDGPKQLLDYP